MDGEEGLIKISSDKEKAKSVLKMAETTLEMVGTIDENKFPSNIAKEYYDIIRELISAVLLLDGYKTYGEGAHKRVIEYLGEKYKQQFSDHEISVIDDLRIVRNKVSYNGFFIHAEYLERKGSVILTIISKLRKIIKNRL